MTNWKDKYKDLEVGQVAWYWHKITTLSGNSYWSPIKIKCWRSMQDGCLLITSCEDSKDISKDFPNGPRCLTPDEMRGDKNND